MGSTEVGEADRARSQRALDPPFYPVGNWFQMGDFPSPLTLGTNDNV